MKQQFRLLSKGQLLDAETFERIQTLRRSVYQSENYQAGIQAFKDNRPPVFKDTREASVSEIPLASRHARRS